MVRRYLPTERITAKERLERELPGILEAEDMTIRSFEAAISGRDTETAAAIFLGVAGRVWEAKRERLGKGPGVGDDAVDALVAGYFGKMQPDTNRMLMRHAIVTMLALMEE